MTTEAQEIVFMAVRDAYKRVLLDAYRSVPEWHGYGFRGKKGGPFEKYIPMSFCETLIDLAGGIDGLRTHWEVDWIAGEKGPERT